MRIVGRLAQPVTLLPPARRVGPASVLVVAGLFALVWIIVGPSGAGWGSFLGQLAGAEAVLLMSISIVLISVLPAVETWFDGIDRTAIWHRRLSVIGLVLLIPHTMFATGNRPPPGVAAGAGHLPGGHGGGTGGLLANVGTWGLVALAVWAVLPRWRAMLPGRHDRLVQAAETLHDIPAVRRIITVCRRIFGGYERWRSVHRLTGLFLGAGFVHGLQDATIFGSPVLRWTYLAAGGIGLAFYLYRETIARFFLPLHDYQVSTVTTLGPGLTELALTPVGRPLQFVPGQFAMLFLEGRNGWRRHPFTMSGAPHDGVVRFTIKALGDDTSAIPSVVEPGMPAVIGGPHGRFSHGRGTGRQIWIAGGIGVTPFLSWVRSLDQHELHAQVDFFYSTDGAAPFAQEITGVAAVHRNLRVHLHNSAAEGYLTADDVLAEVAGDDPRQLSVFLCGPGPMVNTFVRRFRRAGVLSRNIHREHFDWR